MYKVIRKSEGTVRRVADNKTVINLITKDINPNVSLAIMEANDYSEVETAEYNRIYYVVEGKLAIELDGDELLLVPGDSCHVSKGTQYSMSGSFKSLVVNQPAFGS